MAIIGFWQLLSIDPRMVRFSRRHCWRSSPWTKKVAYFRHSATHGNWFTRPRARNTCFWLSETYESVIKSPSVTVFGR